MLPDALLNDLLKKFPGVEIDGNNIRIKGKKVSRIQIDGKDFFAGNMNLAMENLPANIINKVQFYEDKNEGDDDTYKSNYSVLNIKLKKNVKMGWFGKVYGGVGTDERYESGAIMNLFKDTLQISVLGYANNINKAGFGVGDIKSIGGFSRNINSEINYDGQDYIINGISFGGAGDGIQVSKGAGFNLNHHPVKKIDINLNYYYSNTLNTSKSNIRTERPIKDGNFYTENNSQNTIEANTHYIAGTFKYTPGNNTLIILDTRLKFYDQNISSTFEQNSFFENADTTSSSYTLKGTEKTIPKYFNLTISTKSKNKKYSFRLNSSVTDESNRIKGQYINKDEAENKLTDYVRDIKNFGVSNKLTVRRSLKNATSVSLSAEYKYRNEELEFSNFSTPPNLIDTLFNSNFSRQSNWLTVTPSYNFKIKKVSISMGAVSNFLSIRHYNSKYLEKWYYSPSIQITKGNLNITYGENITIPSSFYFINYQDINNPFSFNFKNAYLLPSVNKYITINLDHFNFEKGVSTFFYINARYTRDPVIFIKTLDYEDGISRQTPANADYQKSIGFTLSNSRAIRYNKKKNKIRLSLSINPYLSNGHIIFNDENSLFSSFSMTPSVTLSSEFSESLEASVKVKYYYARSWFKNPFFKNISIWYFDIEPEIVYHKNNYIVESSLTAYLLKADRLSVNSYLLNFAVSKLILKNRNLQIKLSVFDILNKNKGIVSGISGNAITTGERLQLGRFVMASAIFNIRNLRVVKAGGKNNSLIYF